MGTHTHTPRTNSMGGMCQSNERRSPNIFVKKDKRVVPKFVHNGWGCSTQEYHASGCMIDKINAARKSRRNEHHVSDHMDFDTLGRKIGHGNKTLQMWTLGVN